MTLLIGNFGLCGAVLAAIATILVAIRAARVDSAGLLTSARRGIFVLAGLLTVCSIVLMVAELTSDFRIAYVGSHSERTLPIGYKIAAFWAGQEGSLLLWGWLLAALSSIFAIARRKDSTTEHAIALATLAAVIGFFAALMLFAANPFSPASPVPLDGNGLNPMLQDPAMVAHPPVLFVGYAGFAIPFALFVGALFTGRLENWTAIARPWVLISWIFLGAGILLGAWWAYKELGWGGYWAWDPVENASLLPWLTGTALLHSTIGQRTRGSFKRWNAILAPTTFILCVLGTYITRSGIVDSVHGFGHSMVGTFFGVFLTVVCLLTVALLVRRWSALRPERPLQYLVSREGTFAAGNIVLVAMMGITLFGTLLPAFSKLTGGNAVTVTQTFYNRGVLPLVLVMLVLLAAAPMLPFGGTAWARLRRLLVAPLAAGAAAVVVLILLKAWSPWALACGVLGTVAFTSIASDVVRSLWQPDRAGAADRLGAALRGVGANHRHYGAHAAHVGIVMIVAGVAASSLYGTKQFVQMEAGQTVSVGNYIVRMDGLSEVRGSNYGAAQADITVTDASGHTCTLQPQRRYYDKAEDASTKVAIRSNWRQDLYVTLAGWEDSGRVATLQVIVNPLVSWIWAGGLLLTLGGLVCLVPPLARRATATTETARDARATSRQDRPAAAVVATC